MLAAQGLHWLDRQPQGPRWPSFGLAAAVTAGLFVLAFVSMRSVSPWSESMRESSPAPVVVPLRPPPAAVQPKEKETPVPQTPQPTVRRQIERSMPVAAPSLPIVPPTVVPITPPIAAPIAPSTPGDTSRPRDLAPQVPTVPTLRHNSGLSDVDMGIRTSATYAPAGVTAGTRVRNSAKVRDSIITEKLELVPQLARTTPMSSEAQGAIDQSKAQMRILSQRATTAGNGRDVYVPMGEGVGGVGAVGGGKTGLSMGPNGLTYSVPFPLFSSGPSPAERRRNEKLLAEYMAYLRRQNDRILLKRDSIRADSAFRAAMSKPIP